MEKTWLTFLGVWAASWAMTSTPLSAQETATDYYLQHMGDFAGIYNGQIENIYVSAFYSNRPYYKSNDFTTGTLLYNQTEYKEVPMRLDIFRDQLVILSPEKRYGIILNPLKVERVFMHNRTLVWVRQEQPEAINEGYYILLAETPGLRVLKKERCIENRKKEIYRFVFKEAFYLEYGGQYYSLKNKNSFHKAFPGYKKQIDQFAKAQRLNFKQDKERSFAVLAEYCYQLTATN